MGGREREREREREIVFTSVCVFYVFPHRREKRRDLHGFTASGRAFDYQDNVWL